eukprot:gb/GFBE01076610.1/.p1 GENE.gb/GFBE01076610.1/~~gb/GFBE01076610.1/.p1  ORF type:complete len:239 (+),score=43.53 gb/GFBE01076610.1/:1-717(+)
MGNFAAHSGCCSTEPIGEDSSVVEGGEVTATSSDQPAALSADAKGKEDPDQDLPLARRNESAKGMNGEVVERKKARSRTWVSDVPSKVKTFKVKMSKPLGKETSTKLGLDIDYAEENTSLPIVDVSGGLAAKWNEENPLSPLRSGDCIVVVNGVTKDVSKMLKQCTIAGSLELLVVRGTCDETGIDPVASGLLAAEAFATEMEEKEAAKLKGDAIQQAKPDFGRQLSRKKTLNWSVRG